MLTRSLRHFLVWAFALLLALLAAAASWGAIARHRSPPLVLQLWPANGAAFEAVTEAATRRIVTAAGSPGFNADPALIETARAALVSEPTAVAAMRVLAQAEEAAGRLDRARRLMRLAASVTKRDTLVNMWLIEDYSRGDDIVHALAVYDQTLRTLGEGRGPVLTAMASALSDPRLIQPYFRLLRQQPPWSEAFWHVAAQTPGALENAARLRMLIARARLEVPREKDEMMLSALVDQRRFETGFRLFEAIRPPGSAGGALVNNGDFSRASAYQPFDWRLTSTGALGAAIDARAGTLQISAISRGGLGMIAAEQIVRLPPGRYTLRAAYRREAGGGAPPAFVELVCAESGTRMQPLRIELGRSPAALPVNLSGASCRFFWLKIGVSVDEAQQTLELAFDRLQLVPS